MPHLSGITTAVNIPITDAGGLYTATEVESALAEVMADLNGFPNQLKNLLTAEIQQLENIGAATISAAQWGYLGALTADPIGGDGTAGRKLRSMLLLILNGTNPATLKCRTIAYFNGDTIAETDNIAKNATTGFFTLNAGGTILLIEAAGLSGNVLFAFSTLQENKSTTSVFTAVDAIVNDIRIALKGNADGAFKDITVLVDTNYVYLNILYLTDA